MIRHIVMWNIKKDLDKKTTIKELKKRLEALPEKIPYLKTAFLGANFNSSETGRDVVLYTEFETKEDLENYIVHPDHKNVAEYVKSVVCDRVDVDCFF